jgi:2-dehydropantoate 2-reductase
MRIAVGGVGDYGSRLAARLIHAGQDMTLIARGKTLERLHTAGPTATPGGSTLQTAMHIDVVRATDNPAAVGPVDMVLMCVKLYQLDNVMAVASPLVGPHTTVLGV